MSEVSVLVLVGMLLTTTVLFGLMWFVAGPGTSGDSNYQTWFKAREDRRKERDDRAHELEMAKIRTIDVMLTTGDASQGAAALRSRKYG